MLGDPVSGGLGWTYCGAGSLSACRTMLRNTLTSAKGQAASTAYPGDAHCAAGNQWCADAVVQSRWAASTPR